MCNHFMVIEGSSYFVSMPTRVTYGLSASELVESPLALVLGEGTVNPCQLVEICISKFVHGCELTKGILSFAKI